ncbi:unnamed protein product, partial [Rotaria socialis]
MVSNLTALVENVITCPICLKHFDQPRMLPCSHTFCFQCIQQMVTDNHGVLECPKRDGVKVEGNNIGELPLNETVRGLLQLFENPNSNIPLCDRCETNEAEHWCDSDCKHCFCTKCWDIIHEVGVGQYQHHKKLSVKDKPLQVPKCGEHNDEDQTLKYWCELCSKEMCGNCQQFKHKDHKFVLVTEYVKSLGEKTENGLQGVQSCVNYRSDRVDKMLTEIEEESRVNQSEVTTAIGSLRQLIDERERVLLESVRNTEKDEKEKVEDYKRKLQGEQQNLIEQILKFVVVCHDKNPKKLLDAKKPFEDYIKATDTKLLELKPLTRAKKGLPGLKALKDMETQIRNITLEALKYDNEKLRQLIANTVDKSTLNLSSSELKDRDMEIVAEELEINKSLTKLRLFTNQISDIGAQHLADALRTNTTLTDLELHGNLIGTGGLEHLADALRTNKTLNVLTMYGNKVKDQEAGFIADKLKTNEKIEPQIRNINEIPYTNPQLTQLIKSNINSTGVNFAGKNLNDQDMKIVANELLQVNKVVTTLYLQANQIGDVGAQFLADALRVNTTLTRLDLYTNQIGDSGAQYLGEALKTNKSLTLLQLQTNQIGDSGAQYLADALKVNKTLNILCLHENQIGDTGAQHLGNALKTNQTLTELRLYTNKIGDSGAQYLGEALKTNQSLQDLRLQTNKIGDSGAQYLADGLKVNKTLTYLHLAQNQIGDSGTKHLADALTLNKNLTQLYLGTNQISDNGAQLFAEVLKTNKTLTVLDLGKNTITDSGAQQLAEALKTNKTLTELRLYTNKIGDSGAQYLGEALKTNQSLQNLQLQNNKIGDSGAQYLADGLKVNKSLTYLDLRNNKIGDNGAQHIAEGLKVNKTLTQLALNENKITDNGAQQLAEALKTNK